MDFIFPRHCIVCGELLSSGEKDICINCLVSLPLVDELKRVEIEKIFWGIVPVERAASYMYYRKGDYDTMDRYHVKDCFECGSCSYVCPARLPLTHAFRTAKNVLWKQEQDRKAKEANK